MTSSSLIFSAAKSIGTWRLIRGDLSHGQWRNGIATSFFRGCPFSLPITNKQKSLEKKQKSLEKKQIENG